MAATLPLGSSPQGSAFKVETTPKSAQKAAAQPKPLQKIEVKEVTPVSSFVAPSAVEEATNFTADYYRYGAPQNSGGQASGLGDFDSLGPARMITPWSSATDATGKVASSIRLRGYDEKKKKDIDYIPAYTKYILESVQESYAERHQIIETFGAAYIAFFGDRPSIFNFSGMLINSMNVNWVQDFMFFYQNFLRGTKAVDLKARIIMTYGGRQVEGYILGTQNQTMAATEEGVPFGFSMVITQRNFLGFSDDFGIIRGPGGALISDQNLRKLVDSQAGASGSGSSNTQVSQDTKTIKNVLENGKPPASFSSVA